MDSFDFVPGCQPPTGEETDGWWYLFRDRSLVVLAEDNGLTPLFAVNPSISGVTIEDSLFIGSLGDAPCYAAELTGPAKLPPTLVSRNLRSLLEQLPPQHAVLALRASHLLYWDRTNLYCGLCGARMLRLEEEHARYCPNCDRTIFPRTSPAVIVMVVKENTILLARSPRFPPGMYSVIAGFVSPGETLEDCVRREVREEVGIEVAGIRYFASQPWPFPDSLMIAFTARYAGGEIRVDGEEVIEAGWFSRDGLPAIPGKASIARRLIDWFVSPDFSSAFEANGPGSVAGF